MITPHALSRKGLGYPIQITLVLLVLATFIYLYSGSLILTAIEQSHTTEQVVESNVHPIPQKNAPFHLDKPRIPLTAGPRIFDTVLLNDELEWLEIRMNELDKVVDVFVVIESEQTFQRGYKPLYFQQSLRSKAFARFIPRVLHIVVPNITTADEERQRKIGGQGPWAMESYLRNKGVQMALKALPPAPGDWLLHSDVDELPRASALASIKASTSRPEKEYGTPLQIKVLDCNLYYYSFEFMRAEPRKGPVLAQFQLAPPGVDPNSDKRVTLDSGGAPVYDKSLWEDWQYVGNRLRGYAYKYGGFDLVENACWHCSWCFSTISSVHSKASSYSHMEHNTPQYMNTSWIIKHFRQGKDLFDRSEFYDYGGPPTDVPKFIADHPERFSYLIHRYNVRNAGFLDVPENSVNF